MTYTSIQISKETRDTLKGFKIFKKESYDEALVRLLGKENKKV